MGADAILTRHREEAARRWTDAVFARYPFETPGFFRTNKDRFANPVGYATERAACVLYDVVTGLDTTGSTVSEKSAPADDCPPPLSPTQLLPSASASFAEASLSPAAHEALTHFMRLRAVQDMPAHEAVGAIYLLKPVLRDLFLTEALTTGNLAAYLDMESRVDSLALLAFTLYVADRETLYAQRVDDMRRETFQLKRWALRHGFALSSTQDPEV